MLATKRITVLFYAFQSTAFLQPTAALNHASEANASVAFTQHVKRGHQSKPRHGVAGASFAQFGSSPKTFPAYDRKSGYMHPLDASGQDMEKQAVAHLTSSKVMANLKELVEFPTRSYSNAEASQKVENYLKRKFEQMGLTACFHEFVGEGDDSNKLTNVIAHIPGSSADTITVGAHYDSRPFSGSAPGAEDNGSGVAALFAIAQAYADAKIAPKASVNFVAFAGEEPGLLGSKAFAEALMSGGRGIPTECKSSSSFLQLRRGEKSTRSHQAIIMDEIGWTSPALQTPTVNLESFDWTGDVMDHLRESSQLHNGDAIRVVHSNHPFGSDHMSFLDNSMKAVLTINGDDESYPNYHQSSDTIENVNPGLLGMISKMNLGALIRMAGIRST